MECSVLETILPRYFRLIGGDRDSEFCAKDSSIRRVRWAHEFYVFPGYKRLSILNDEDGSTYKTKGVYPMDISSALPVLALNVNSDKPFVVLDLCCCPGGKFQMLSEKLSPGSTIVGVDISKSRINVCKSLLRKWNERMVNVLGDVSSARQLIYACDGTTFMWNGKNAGELVYDSDVVKQEALRKGARKRLNKSAREREKKQLRILQNNLGVVDMPFAGTSQTATAATIEKPPDSNNIPIKGSICTVLGSEAAPVLFDFVLVDAECTHDASYKHMKYLPSSTSSATNTSSTSASSSTSKTTTSVSEVSCSSARRDEAGGSTCLESKSARKEYSTKATAVLSHQDVAHSKTGEAKAEVAAVAAVCGMNTISSVATDSVNSGGQEAYEVREAKEPLTSEALTALQRGLLMNGFQQLKVGGELVYSTCSQEAAQNEEVVQWLLDALPAASVALVSVPALLQELLLPEAPRAATMIESTGDRDSRDAATSSSTPLHILQQGLPELHQQLLVEYPTEAQRQALSSQICDYIAAQPQPVYFDSKLLPGTIRMSYRGGTSGHYIAKLRKLS
jgi:16S rRNA C967 or C1407 C5-methylase (RsmB/RsmF family)